MPTSPVEGHPPRTLADQLRSWPDERLARLLEARPDLAGPAPRDSAQLAARAVVRTSVLRALESLDAFDLAVLEAIANTSPATPAQVTAVVNAEPTALAEAVERLAVSALVWGGGSLRATTAVAEILALPPGPEPARVAALVEELDPQARAILEHLEAHDAAGTSDRSRSSITVASASTPTEHLLARRLLVPRDDRHVVVPWNVLLHLRGGRSTRERVDVAPSLATTTVDPGRVDHAAAGAALEFTRRTEMLLEHWGTRPPGALRTGGLGVRELKNAAGFVHLTVEETALIVEVAAEAGLLAVGMTDDTDAAWLPTEAFDAWQLRSAAERWEQLASAWLTSSRLLSAIGGRDGDPSTQLRTGRPINALSPGLERAWLADLRASVLTELATAPSDVALASGTGLPSLVERLRWRHPRHPQTRLESVEPTLREAAALGIVAIDAVAGAGRALVERADAAGVLTPLLPAPVDHILVQADLTAIAPGPLEQELARQVALVADVESRGGATVYRFSAQSVRRAFDAGWSAAEIQAFLTSSSRTPLPQALGYLIEDVARRFGTIRAGHAEAFLRSDDEAALAELIHNPAAANLRLRRIAPTVLVSDVPLGTLLPRLRELGVAPVVEAVDGTVRVARPDVFRSRAPRGSRGIEAGRARARAVARTTAVVSAIRSGDRAALERPSRGPATTPADVMTLLRQTIEERASVLIGYLDNHGVSTERIVRPERVEGGRLTAYDERADSIRDFAIHRITTAARH